MARNGVTTITVRGNVTEAIAALDTLGIKAEETAAKTDGAFGGKGLSSLKRFSAGGILALGAAGVASIKMAGNFQQSMTQLVTGAGESESAIKGVSQGILALAPQVGTTTKQLAAGMYLIESAGFHGADGLKVLKAAAEGAKVGNADLGSVANAVSSVLVGYHLKAGSAATVTSQLVATTAAGKMHMQDLADSLSAVVPVAAKAGLNFGQVGGALATMTVTGMSAQQASQDLAFTIRNLQAPSAVASNEMAQFGINSNDLSQNLGKRGLTGTLQILTEAITSHMGPAGQVLLNTFNQSMGAGKDLQIELNNMSPGLRKLAEEYMNGTITGKDFRSAVKALPADQAALAAGFVTTYQSAHKWNDLLRSGRPDALTYNAALEKMTGGSVGLNTALMLTGGNAATFSGNVKSVSGAAADAHGNVKGWTDVQKDLNFKLDDAKAKAEVLGIKIGTALIPVAEKILGIVMKLVGWFEKHSGVAKALAIMLGVTLVAGFAAATIASMTFATALTGGIGLAVAGLVLGIIYLATHWDKVWKDIKRWTDEAIGFLRGKFGTLVQIIVLGPFAILTLLALHWSTVWNGIKQVTGQVVGGLLTTFRELGDAFFAVVEGILGAASHLPFVGHYFASANRAVKGAQSDFDGTLSQWSSDAHNWGSNLGQNLTDGISNTIRQNIPAGVQNASLYVSQVIAAMHKGAQTASPSKLTIKLGHYIAEGLDIGMKEGMPSVTHTARHLTGPVLTTAMLESAYDARFSMWRHGTQNMRHKESAVRGDIVNNFYITSQADARQIANETTWALGRLIT